MVDGKYNPYRNPLRQSDLPLTDRIKTDAMFDIADLIQDCWSALVKVIVSYAVCRLFLHMEYEVSMEVALLLGAADLFTKERKPRLVTDIRKRVSFLPSGKPSSETEDEHIVQR